MAPFRSQSRLRDLAFTKSLDGDDEVPYYSKGDADGPDNRGCMESRMRFRHPVRYRYRYQGGGEGKGGEGMGWEWEGMEMAMYIHPYIHTCVWIYPSLKKSTHPRYTYQKLPICHLCAPHPAHYYFYVRLKYDHDSLAFCIVLLTFNKKTPTSTSYCFVLEISIPTLRSQISCLIISISICRCLMSTYFHGGVVLANWYLYPKKKALYHGHTINQPPKLAHVG